METQIFRYIIALSFDKMCLDGCRDNIFSISAVIYDLFNMRKKPIAKFNKYVRPTIFSKEYIAPYDINNVKDIENAQSLTKVLQNFDLWLKSVLLANDLVLPKMPKSKNQNECAFLTWGNDIEYILFPEIRYKCFEIPSYLNQWINLKSVFIFTTKYPNPDGNITLENAFEYLNLRFEGGHTAQDNTLNLVILARKLYKTGGKIWINKELQPLVLENRFLSNQADG